MIYKRVIFLIVFTALVNCCDAGELFLVKGSEKANIVISNSASPVEKYAARELQRAVKIMSGVELEIVSTVSGPSKPHIIIGTPLNNIEVLSAIKLLALEGKDEEQVAVRREGNKVYIAGNSPRAALYATYTFLEDVLGARWFWPGESGEYLPRHNIISIDALDISEFPAFKIRSLAITGGNGDTDTDVWMARNKLNVVSSRPGIDASSIASRREKGFLVRVAGHNIVLPDEMLKAHPDYLPEVAGKRQFYPRGASHLCWSNPGVQNEVAKMIAGWWDQSPFPDVVHFYPADQTQYCECESCKAMGDISTRWQKFSAIVIDKVNASHPGKKYWTYAYLDYKKVPKTDPAPFDFIAYTLYDASYRHLLSSGNENNKSAISEIDGWLDKKVNLGIRGYEFIIFKTPVFVPMVSWVADEINWFHNRNISGYLSELPAYDFPKRDSPDSTFWNCSRMSLYAAARLLWNNKIPATTITDNWNEVVYGIAAEPMKRYYNEIEEAWKNNPKKISVFNNLPVSHVDGFLTPTLFQQFFGYFSQALNTISSLKDTIERNRITSQLLLERKMLGNWKETYDLKYLRAGRYRTGIKKIISQNNLPSAGTSLAAFEEKGSVYAKDATHVSLGWRENKLMFHIVCKNVHAPGIYKGVMKAGNTAIPQGLQLYIQPDPGKPAFIKLEINYNGTLLASKTFSGRSFTVTTDPVWNVEADTRDDDWILDGSISFTSLGIDTAEGSRFKMAVRRSLATGNTSGWPDAYTADSPNFSLVTLAGENESVRPGMVLFGAGLDNGPLAVELQQKKWNVEVPGANEAELKNLLAEKTGVLLMHYPGTKDKPYPLSAAFINTEIRSFIENGGTVIISANGDVPVDKWFGVPAVKWMDSKNATVRKSAFVNIGTWLTQPNDIAQILNTGVTPLSGYTFLSPGWTDLARMTLINGEQASYLMTIPVGKGMLVLTSSSMGYNNGTDMFGYRNTLNVIKLVENLLAQHAGKEK